ncbi:MAG TPA: hypothetical protein VI750_12260 [Pyrinomonadaceae bacterium]|nr:hypothetical protein [Pyrinomonadaceae bacterium]
MPRQNRIITKKGRKGKASRKKGRPTGPCTIPGPVDPAVLNTFAPQKSNEREAIKSYVEWQSPKEKVSYVEKVLTERIFDRTMDAYDVHTDGERYWVITQPTNLYSQRLFPSLDYTLSFHVGVTARMMADRKSTATDEQQDRIAAAWRRWTQAAEALGHADEAEEFQAVGMRCRECLIAMIRAIAQSSMVPAGTEEPKAAAFIPWSEIIADAIASGASAAEVRGYLKAMARSTWQLVSWLTHAGNAVRYDAEMALDASHNTLAAFSMAVLRNERGTPERCPQCTSYRLRSVHVPELELDPPYLTQCEVCGWNSSPEPESQI